MTISSLRAELAKWIERARQGEEIIVTDRGTPVARLSSVDTTPLIEQLTKSGILGKPRRTGRPTARGASRVQPRASVSELVGEQRR